MHGPVLVRRSVCARCLRPQSACICGWIAPVVSPVEVLILHHPLEVANPKGSARLLHLSLPNSRLAVGEGFDEAQLRGLLHEPWRNGQAGQDGTAAQAEGSAVAEGSAEAGGRDAAAPMRRQPVLLYPELPGPAAHGARQAGRDEAASAGPWPDPACLRLVVLDATWRKSRKMLYMNPQLRALPRLALQDVPASRYLIRKAHLPHQLSTLEAACLALMRLERDAPKFQPLLDAFDGFIGQQLGYRPR